MTTEVSYGADYGCVAHFAGCRTDGLGGLRERQDWQEIESIGIR